MFFWYVIVGGIVFLGLLVIPLRSRWYMGCGMASLGAILGGGAGFAAGWIYSTYFYVKPRPRHDMDFAGLETLILCFVALPVLGVLLGLVLGIWSAYLLQEWLPDKSPKDRN